MKGLIFILILFPCSVFAADLGQLGNVYNIAEMDMMEEVISRAEKVDWKSLVEKSREDLKKKVGRVDKPFPKAVDNATYYIDLTTRLEQAIYTRDRSGKPKVLYPKGYKFNALDYTKIRSKFLIFDAEREEETQWFKAIFASDLNTMPIISRGNALELAKEIGRKVYVADDELLKRFDIKATPTIIYQEKNKLRADEFYLEKAGENQGELP